MDFVLVSVDGHQLREYRLRHVLCIQPRLDVLHVRTSGGLVATMYQDVVPHVGADVVQKQARAVVVTGIFPPRF